MSNTTWAHVVVLALLAVVVGGGVRVVCTGIDEAANTERTRLREYAECVQASMRAYAVEENHERNTAACGVILTFKFN